MGCSTGSKLSCVSRVRRSFFRRGLRPWRFPLGDQPDDSRASRPASARPCSCARRAASGLTQAGEMFLERAAPAYAGLADAYEAARNLGNRPARTVAHQPDARRDPALVRDRSSRAFAKPIPTSSSKSTPRMRSPISAPGASTPGCGMGESLDADVIAVRLTGPFRFAAFGAPAYFERHGRPQEPADLRHHRCVRLRLSSGRTASLVVHGRQSRDRNRGHRPGDRQRPERDHHGGAQRHRAGHDRRTRARGNWSRAARSNSCCPNVRCRPRGCSSITPAAKQVMPKLRAFIDYAREYLPDDIGR